MSDTYTYCSVCNSDFIIFCGGKSDYNNYVDGPCHANFTIVTDDSNTASSQKLCSIMVANKILKGV